MDDPILPPASKIPFIQRKDLCGHLAIRFEMTPSMRRALAEKMDDNIGLISTRALKTKEEHDAYLASKKGLNK